jgi:hypothetical protein
MRVCPALERSAIAKFRIGGMFSTSGRMSRQLSRPVGCATQEGKAIRRIDAARISQAKLEGGTEGDRAEPGR